MAKISNRKLFLFGRYSLALLLPKKWLKELGLQAGDHLQMEFERKRQRIVIRLAGSDEAAAEQTSSSPPSPQPNKPTTPPIKQRGTAQKESSEPEGWQPIPNL